MSHCVSFKNIGNNMTDISISHAPLMTDVSADLIAKRYRSERRFRSYGLISLGITALFLAFLVFDIVSKGIPAFFEHTIKLPVIISAEKIDVANPVAGDYTSLAKDALKTAMPAMTSRADRKALLSILSSGASDDMRQQVTGDPSLIGKTIDAPLLLNADADLYFKGGQTSLSKATGTGELGIALEDKDYVLTGAIAGIQAHELVLFNNGALRITSVSAEKLVAEKLIEPSSVGAVATGKWQHIRLDKAQSDRRINDQQVAVLETLKNNGLVSKSFAWRFLSTGDSREPELAGIRGALAGSILTIIITLAISLPTGIAAALYLEEFARKGAMTNFIEVNINNLAAVPSIIFGLLGLAVFLNFFGMPRSAPLIGGLVLALLVMPTIIIAARAAFRSVPPSIKEAALGVGASHQQAVFHHVLPLAVPGILTGTILGVARAFGETAPLLMIGMVAFIVDVPDSFTDAATLLPVQIYLWSDLPELGFQSRTAAAIIVLMCVLFALNAVAIYLRKRFERRW
jgi:phosphate transport system permease protein